MAALGDGAAIMVKAIAGGGGRGMRPVHAAAELPAAFERCRAEALSAFGNGDLYVERLFPRARHIEIQVLGDGRSVAHLGRTRMQHPAPRQKLIEIAPAPASRPFAAARAGRGRLAGRENRDRHVEFLVDRAAANSPSSRPIRACRSSTP